MHVYDLLSRTRTSEYLTDSNTYFRFIPTWTRRLQIYTDSGKPTAELDRLGHADFRVGPTWTLTSELDHRLEHADFRIRPTRAPTSELDRLEHADFRTHFLMYGKGMQTWEYSPVYAIRSYAYLLIHALPLKLYQSVFSANKVILFYILRCLFALICAGCEVYFYKGICKHFGGNTGRIYLTVSLLSGGMFFASSAYLPSTFCMYFTCISMGGWYLRQYEVAIFGTAISAILGWPFAGILGVPIAIDIVLRKKKVKFFTAGCIVALALFLVPTVLVDSNYYGKLVITPLNIVLYNVFTDHGPDLYGVEPFSFYFVNGFLNFNVIFILAIFCLPIIVNLPVWLVTLPMYLWIVVFFTRPHKEERFLYPIYPLFSLFGAVAVDHIQKLASYVLPQQSSRHYTEKTSWIAMGICTLFSLMSVSRILAVYHAYHAPLDIYVELNRAAADPKVHTLSTDKSVNLCVGKEWYRYPSSFFLPGDKIPRSLPKPYSSGPDATKIIPTEMNDMNKEEKSRYINVTKCHYLIDLDVPEETKYEPRYSLNTEDWKVLHSVKFLHASRSHRVFRAFYIPFISHHFCTFVDYNLLKTTRTKKVSRSRLNSSR
ncbi:hypothetical protein FSP39_003298 [Pinctada imbricata]|uniref:Mannosyltransferase n=1 Tax=Pinctada imbricata TaxID=66713 RepID=A0AA88XZ05_PINIB|nr:hypothetical protein FSP39_003298 [Pinctada imbricata]